MIRLLQLIFLGHFHVWETIQVKNFYERHDAGKPGAMPTGQVYVQQCKSCGKFVRRDLH